MFWLRWKRPDIPRPYRCTGYPWLPAIYVLIGTAWTLNTIFTRPTEAFWGTAIVLIGVPGYLYWKRSNRKEPLPSRFVLPAHSGKWYSSCVSTFALLARSAVLFLFLT